MVARAVLAGEMLSQLVARVAGGDTIHSAAVALGLKPASVGMRARRDPIFRKQLGDAAASRGRSPGSKRGARDTQVLIESLQAGSSLAEACLAAGISMSGLYYRRSKDADFDRTVHALLSRKARFDAAGKEAALAQISRGSSLGEAMAHAGVRSRSTFWRHLKSDAAFAAAVHAAQGGYGEIGGRVAPTKAKVKFERLLDVLPFSRSLDDACSVVGLSVPAFRGLIARCERRRTAYFAAVDKLPDEGRGKRALRNGRVDSDLYAVVDHIRDGMSLSQALRLVGIPYPMFMRRRRRRPQLEQALVHAGHRTTSLGRRQMDDVDQQVAVLAKLTEGVPLYGLGWFNLPNGATVSQYAQEKPDFRALLVSALREGGERRRGYPSARINAALEAIAAGVPVQHLPSRGLPGHSMLRYYRCKDPGLEQRYQEAMRIARGDSRDGVVLCREDLIAMVERKLPRSFTPDERRDCANQAWLDAFEGTLTAQNVTLMVKRYVAGVRPLDRNPSAHVDSNGDVRANWMD